MNYANRLIGSFRFKLFTSGLISFLSFFLVHGAASAAVPIPNNTLPKPADFSQGSGVNLIVASRGSGYVLDSSDSTVRIYTKSPNVTLTITGGAHCGSPDAGIPGSIKNDFDVYWLQPSNDPSNPFQNRTPLVRFIRSQDIACGEIKNIPIATVNGQQASTLPGYQGYYVFEVEAVLTDRGAGGWNMFKYSVSPGAYLSYYAGSGDHFALKDADQGVPGNPGDFHLGFAPNCSINGPTNVPLKWFDADVGSANQPGGPIHTDLYEYAPNGSVNDSQAFDVNTVDNAPGQHTITVKPGYKYEWVWRHVYSANGIQFQLPFDSFTTAVDFSTACKASVACTATANPNNPNVGQGTTITVVLRNTAASGGPDVPGTYQLRQTSPSGGAQGVQGGGIAPGGSQTFRFSIQPRGSPQTIPFRYALFDGTTSGAKIVGSSPLCTVTVQWGRGSPPSSLIVTGCTAIHVNVSSSARHMIQVGQHWVCDQSHVDPLTGETICDRGHWEPDYGFGATNSFVDIQLRFHNNDGAQPDQTYSERVGSNPAVRDYDPFAMPNSVKLWPHRSYTVDLWAINSGDDYNQDGNQIGGGYAHVEGPYQIEHDVVNGDPDPTGRCMDVNNSPIQICSQSSTADVEPGDTAHFDYTVGTFTNYTDQSYAINDPGGSYGFTVQTQGGYANGQITRVSPSVMSPGNTGPIVVSVTVTANWAGTFTIQFVFQGREISLENWDPTDCNNNPGGVTTTAGGPTIVATRPYFKAYNGDIRAGGTFADAQGNCSYSGGQTSGTILAYAYPTGANGGPRGASADFGAYALGLIQGELSGFFGFFDSAKNNAGYNALSFANQGIGSPLNGGNMAGGSANPGSEHCVADYFDAAAQTRTPSFTPSNSVNLSGVDPGGSDSNNIPGQYFYQPAGGALTISAGGGYRVRSGDRVTLFVNGNVYITSNILYDESWDPTQINSDSAPYLAIIAKGNIIVDPGVSELDGLYVAQGDGDSSGIFATCGFGSQPANADQVTHNCMSKLTVNGAVVAGDIKPLRSNGYLKFSSVGEGSGSGNVAEVFNFIPAMVLGAPNFQPQQSSGAITPGALEGLTSLPPVF